MLTDGYHDLPPGYLAAVVTYLEMRAPAPLRGHPAPEGVTLTRVPAPDPAWYRALFTHVGADWLWFSRLRLTDAALSTILSDPKVEVCAGEKDGTPQGLLELDFREAESCELAYFGLGPGLIGSGTGAWLMDQAISRAWSHPIRRFHVHTCTLDSPQALGFYIRSGFMPVRRRIEITEDPRLTGDLPRDAASHIPIVAPDS